jgi:hypothetical protein
MGTKIEAAVMRAVIRVAHQFNLHLLQQEKADARSWFPAVAIFSR